MRVFIWEYVEELTDNYHSSGGVAIVAKSLRSAEKLEPRIKGIKPSRSYQLATGRQRAHKEEVFIFPNAGCC